MPAIQPARLKQQAALLAEHFDNPAAFVRSLHHLLDFYADRAHRQGQSGEPAPLLAAYNVRPPVLRQVFQELATPAREDPENALALVDALWGQSFLEFRLLAAQLLGQVSPEPPEAIIQRAISWIKADPQDRLMNIVLTYGLARMRQENREKFIHQVREWLSSSSVIEQQVGLHALRPLIEDVTFENAPVFFRLIQPLARTVPPKLRLDLLDVLGALARRFPQETAYFLRQNLETPNSADVAWLIRQCLSDFPLEIQESLRAAVRRFAR